LINKLENAQELAEKLNQKKTVRAKIRKEINDPECQIPCLCIEGREDYITWEGYKEVENPDMLDSSFYNTIVVVDDLVVLVSSMDLNFE